MRILLVDTDTNFLTSLAQGLTAFGHDVLTCTSIVRAQTVLADDMYDAVFCELMMSDGGAAVLLRALRQSGVNVPLIVMTGRDFIASSPLFLQGFPEAAERIEKNISVHEIDALLRAPAQ